MKAFSLVELLIVIAIVGILAAISSATYKNYAVKSRIASLVPIIDSNFTKAKSYYERNGSWPSAAALGYEVAPGDWRTVANPAEQISPLIASGYFGTDDPPNCPPYAYYTYTLDPAEFPGDIIVAGDYISYFIGEAKNDFVIVGCDTRIGGVNIPGGNQEYVKCKYSYTQAYNLTCN